MADSVALARDGIDSLRDAVEPMRSVTPFFVALTPGKLYVRLQMEAPDDGQVSHDVLDLCEQLSARALKLFGR